MKKKEMRPLTCLEPGEKGKVYTVKGGYKERLASLGIVPGAFVEVERKKPAYIIAAGYTRLILEPAVADFIYVMA